MTCHKIYLVFILKKYHPFISSNIHDENLYSNKGMHALPSCECKDSLQFEVATNLSHILKIQEFPIKCDRFWGYNGAIIECVISICLAYHRVGSSNHCCHEMSRSENAYVSLSHRSSCFLVASYRVWLTEQSKTAAGSNVMHLRAGRGRVGLRLGLGQISRLEPSSVQED